MCNLYNITTNRRAIIEFSQALRDLVGNLEPELDIFPDLPAPIVQPVDLAVTTKAST